MSVEYLEDKNSDDFIKYIFSTNPKPSANSEGWIRPSLSNPAASPIGFVICLIKSCVCNSGLS